MRQCHVDAQHRPAPTHRSFQPFYLNERLVIAVGAGCSLVCQHEGLAICEVIAKHCACLLLNVKDSSRWKVQGRGRISSPGSKYLDTLRLEQIIEHAEFIGCTIHQCATATFCGVEEPVCTRLILNARSVALLTADEVYMIDLSQRVLIEQTACALCGRPV